MKTEKRYTKLTHEAALKLLQENNWCVVHCVFDDMDWGPANAVYGIHLGLHGMHAGKFVSTSGTKWKHCWKIEEVEVDPFDEWKREREDHFGKLSIVQLDIAVDAFNSGRDYEREQK